MDVTILPAGSNRTDDPSRKDFSLPPDKSIFHRILLIGSLTDSIITIPITSPTVIAEDIKATIGALKDLGVKINIRENAIELHGVGLHGLKASQGPIYCGNSGTTARLLVGILAGQKFDSVLRGDESLSKRPMKRLADLLEGMSAEIDFPKGEGLPVHIHGKPLQGKDISLPVVSAQIKSALLLAGLYAEGITNVIEATPTRDHTERMLKAFGASVGFDLPKTFTYELPGDISSAAFLIVVAILCKQNITLANVGLNPTRKRFLDIMIACGLQVSLPHNVIEHGEERATLEIAGSSFLGFNGYTFTREDIALCIDEIPAMAVLAAFFDGKTLFRNANELRRKESDRISSIAENLMRAGVGVEEFDDGFSVLGCNERQIGSCVLDSFGDHRIAMAVSVLALRAREAVTIRNAEVVSISFPNFFHELVRIVGKERIIKA